MKRHTTGSILLCNYTVMKIFNYDRMLDKHTWNLLSKCDRPIWSMNDIWFRKYDQELKEKIIEQS